MKNIGSREGDEVVQLYVKHLNSAVERPIQELKGFRRITLLPGERKTVEMPLQAKSLAYWDANRHAFVSEAGKIEVRVGALPRTSGSIRPSRWSRRRKDPGKRESARIE